MNSVNKNNTLIIMASNEGFPFDGYVDEGYNTFSAYKSTNLFTRVIREICFRLPFLPKKVWFNKEILKIKPDYIYVRDSIITRDYLLWLKNTFQSAHIIFYYDNKIGKARHLFPNQIPKGITVWTFDQNDSEKYNIHLKKVTPYFKKYLNNCKREKKYDLLFVGRDKGRGDWLKRLETFLCSKGIKTKFYITADGRLSLKKPYYERMIPYSKVSEWVAESRALLNVGLKKQKGITLRDIESYFNHIKLVTTDECIKETEIYDELNTFFLTDDNWDELVDFLRDDYKENKSISWKNHTPEDALKEMAQFEE